MLEDRNEKEKDWSEQLNTPKPITPWIDDEGFITLKKQDVDILRVHTSDHESIYPAILLLNGLLRAGVVYAEIEQVRDLLIDVVGS